MIILALFLLPVRLYSLQLMPLGCQRVYHVNSIRKNFCLSSSKFDTNIDDLYLLSRIELQTLSKAYKLKANSKTQDLIEQIKLFRGNLNDNNGSENEILPSKEQTSKVSPLEKTSIVDNLDGEVPNRKNMRYGVKNGDIGEVLKDQGVQIDDLLALRDSLMKGGFKFNSEDEDDFEFSGDDFNGSNIEEEFYDENYSFDDNIDSEVDIKDILLDEEEKSKANKLKSQQIKEFKRLQKEQNSLNNMPSLDKKNQNDSSKKNAKPLITDSIYVKKPVVTESTFNRIQQKQFQQKEEFLAAENLQNIMNSKDLEKSNPSDSNDKKIKELPIYEKLNRREVVSDEYDDEDDSEENNFESLEALDARMDELYGALDSSSTIKAVKSIKTITPKIAKAITTSNKISEGHEKKIEVDDGINVNDSDPISNDIIDILDNNIMSDINNPIKWRNGRLVNDKDIFYEKIKNEKENLDVEREMSNKEYFENSQKNNHINQAKKVIDMKGVTIKNIIEHLETTIGYDGLFEETALRCFSEKPSINSILKVLRLPNMEWARKKLEYLYVQSKRREDKGDVKTGDVNITLGEE